ncbi:N-methyl-L-tryptophan oxidase-like isoform X3 [Scylla paramamosain]|uniref:N-methyl-L-tryptophan oxidase-like isoform X3 n=1 Tax=Scylla paramamosain TaxID=85552 RepID=UPI003083D3A9
MDCKTVSRLRLYDSWLKARTMILIMEEKVFDLVVVGAGLMGSAAAFHASQLSKISVCLVGPPEPKNRQEVEIFGCWHDEGRVYYRISPLHTWQVVSSRSIERLANLEELTGIKICTKTGCIHIYKDKKKHEENIEVSRQLDLEGQDISHTWKNIFPFLNMPEGASICYEEKCAGHLNPRRLVEAHQKAAQLAGTHLLKEIVMTVRPSETMMHRWEVVTESGTVLQCQQVLVATGGYAALKPLFQHVKPGFVPKLELRTQTVAFLQISEEEAHRLWRMPCMVIRHPFKNLDGGYVVPPIKYPDGKWYVKMGHGRAYEETRSSLAEVTHWYQQQSGVPECVQQLTQYLKYLLPGLRFLTPWNSAHLTTEQQTSGVACHTT